MQEGGEGKRDNAPPLIKSKEAVLSLVWFVHYLIAMAERAAVRQKTQMKIDKNMAKSCTLE